MTGSSSPDPRWDVPLRDLLDTRAARTPDVVALMDEAGRSLTFGALSSSSARLASRLAECGVAAGARVAWQLPAWIETVVVSSALSRLGAVQVPLPHTYRSSEVREALQQTDADLLLTPGIWRGHDFAAVETGRCASATITRDGLTAFAGSAVSTPAARPSLGADVRWVFFTSGTSGAPKGVRHTDRSVTVAATTMADAFSLTAGDRSAIAFPLGHIGGVAWLVASLQTGCRLLLADRFDTDVIDGFAAQGVTLAGVSTAFHLAYRDRARELPERRLFPVVRAYPGGAATKPPSLHHELRAEVGGVGIVAGYGLTECPMISMATVRDPSDKLAETEGRPGPGVAVEVRSPSSGAVLPPGQAGELWVLGPQLFQGYVRATDTAGAVDDRGFFRTGDLGLVDADGFVVITGRLKDVIIRKGENISAKEVEDHLFAHPDIADVVVVGLPDERLGERCCAVVVPRAGRQVPSVAALGAFLHDRGLMTQKWPEQVVGARALPRNAAGKVLKHALVGELHEGAI